MNFDDKQLVIHCVINGKRFVSKYGIIAHNLCSEDKGADKLPGYRVVDLCLCFRIYKKYVVS